MHREFVTLLRTLLINATRSQEFARNRTQRACQYEAQSVIFNLPYLPYTYNTLLIANFFSKLSCTREIFLSSATTPFLLQRGRKRRRGALTRVGRAGWLVGTPRPSGIQVKFSKYLWGVRSSFLLCLPSTGIYTHIREREWSFRLVSVPECIYEGAPLTFCRVQFISPLLKFA